MKTNRCEAPVFGRREAILLCTIGASVLTGSLYPPIGLPFHPYIGPLVMCLLFFSFLSIRLTEIMSVLKHDTGFVLILTAWKLVVLPLLAWGIFSLVLPEYALGALLVAGSSTGVIAPFLGALVGAHVPLVLCVTVFTSLLVPFTLPLVVLWLSSQAMEVSFIQMAGLLAVVIFLPLTAAEAFRRISPRGVKRVNEKSFPLSLTGMALVCLAVFSRYSEFLHQQPVFVLVTLAAASVLGLFFFAAGLLPFPHSDVTYQVGAGAAMVFNNSVLVIVFSEKFFGPVESTLCALYMFPLYGLLIPFRLFGKRREGRRYNRNRGKADPGGRRISGDETSR